MHKDGNIINHKTVIKIMKQEGLVCKVKMKKFNSYKGEVGNIYDNLIDRKFCSEYPNLKWVTDITQFRIGNTKIYLSTILDLYNREIISYNISNSPTVNFVNKMVIKAMRKIKSKHNGLILHSDQGFQFQNIKYQKLLQKYDIKQSMSRKGNCLDNSVMENFYSNLKSELLYLNKFNNSDIFIKKLEEYIKFYNHDRIKQRLGWLSPTQFRLKNVI